MSGASFTLTPNLGLFKPTLDDDPKWGEHWNKNADRIDASYGGIASGGPFLPLTGGTVTGNTTIRYDSTGNNAIDFTPASVYGTDVSGQQMHSHMIVASTGGTAGSVYANTLTGSSIQGAPNNYIWNQLNVVDYHGTGGQGQHVASYNQALRRTVNVGGRPNNPDMFGAVFEIIDYSNTPTGTMGGSMNGIEIDMTCGNVDDAKQRRGIGIYINKANAGDVMPTVDTGLHMAGITGHFLSMIRLEANFDTAAIDLKTSIRTTTAAHTIWLGDANDIALNTTGDGTLSWDLTSGSAVFSSNLKVAGGYIVGGSGGPTWTTGTAVPTVTQPVGSIYSRAGGAVGATLYVSRGGGTWAAVAGV